jgi:outer membrane murein-binding lipoprotein Lpp
VEVMAIPAAIMDSAQQKKIDQLGEVLRKLEAKIANLEMQNKELKKEIQSDVHDHVKKLTHRIQVLQNEIKSLKQ